MGVRYGCPSCGKELQVEDQMPARTDVTCVGAADCHYCEAEFDIEVSVQVYADESTVKMPPPPKKAASDER